MDDTGNGRWLTYSELAAIRGINRASAVKLVQRERWRRSPGNDRSRIVRVLVPDEWLTLAKENPPDTSNLPAMSVDNSGMMAVLISRAERAEERADEANKRAEAAVALADRTLGQLAEATAEIGRLRDRLTAAEERAMTAHETAEELRRADAARRARGLFVRLLAAWHRR